MNSSEHEQPNDESKHLQSLEGGSEMNVDASNLRGLSPDDDKNEDDDDSKGDPEETGTPGDPSDPRGKPPVLKAGKRGGSPNVHFQTQRPAKAISKADDDSYSASLAKKREDEEEKEDKRKREECARAEQARQDEASERENQSQRTLADYAKQYLSTDQKDCVVASNVDSAIGTSTTDITASGGLISPSNAEGESPSSSSSHEKPIETSSTGRITGGGRFSRPPDFSNREPEPIKRNPSKVAVRKF